MKYDTIVGLPEIDGLRPGMSAEAEVFLADYQDVLTVPVTAVLETVEGTLCWVRLATGQVERRSLVVGDSNDVMIIVESGLAEGEEVVLNPRGALQEAREISLRPSTEENEDTQDSEQQEPGQQEPVQQSRTENENSNIELPRGEPKDVPPVTAERSLR